MPLSKYNSAFGGKKGSAKKALTAMRFNPRPPFRAGATECGGEHYGGECDEGASEIMHRYHILDACCGSKMFWFNPDHRHAVYVDHREETHQLKDRSSAGGFRTLTVRPSVVADFRRLPFLPETFSLVIFDPPHLIRNGKNGWMAKKYGTLNRQTWKDDLEQGFAECFRVCRTDGTVVLKWNASDIPVREVLGLTKYIPVVGTKKPIGSKTSWFVFCK